MRAPSARGSAFHWIPVRSTETIAANACRSCMRGRPPLACDGGGGIRGIPRSHNASLTSHGWLLLIHGSPLQDQPIQTWALYRKHEQDKPASVSFSVPFLLQKHE